MIQLDWNSLSPDVQRRNKGLKELLKPNKSKYQNESMVIDGILFQSRKEADRYQELKLEKRVGHIEKFELQPRFLLQEGFTTADGKRVQPMYYVADFKVWYRDGRTVIIDTKGFRNRVYLNKLKLFRKRYPDVEFIEE